MTNGFFKLQRKFFSHGLWAEEREFSRAEAFLDLLQLAAFKPTKRIVKGSLVALKTGQLCGSERYLSGRWRWSTKKVRTFLTLLEADKMVDLEKKREGTVVTLRNYERYAIEGSDKEAPRKHQGSTKEAPRKQIEEGKERKEGEGVGNRPAQLCTIEQAIAYGPTVRMTEDESRHWWHTRNKSGWTCGTQGGGAPRKITSWQSDMATASWVGESLAKSKGQKPTKRDFTSNDVSI